MKKILLLRHCDTILREEYAKNGVFDPVRDLERPLSNLGKYQAKKIAKNLDVGVDYVFCSPAKRTKQSAKPTIKKHRKTKLVLSKHILPNCGLEGYFSVLDSQEFKNAKVPLIVGHEPDMSTFIKYITRANVALTKGTLVEVKYNKENFDNGRYDKDKDGVLSAMIPPPKAPKSHKKVKLSKNKEKSKKDKTIKIEKDRVYTSKTKKIKDE